MVTKKRRKRYSFFRNGPPPPSVPLDANGGIKAREPGDLASHAWWSQRWIEVMEGVMDVGRLRRGRNYARKGQVLSLAERPGGIQARVQGSRVTPYKVTFQIAPLSDAQWEKVIDDMSGQAIFAAQLLAGHVPEQIETLFAASGVSLFPEKRGDLLSSCSCPDYANPCKHIAAVHYVLADRLDEDPFLLFRLRGRTQEQILQSLRQRRQGEAVPEEETEPIETVLPLDQTLEHFWDLGAPLDDFHVTVRAPQIEMPLLRRLGDPAFFPEASLQQLLGPAYQAITRAALDSAFAEEAEPEVEDKE